MGAYSFGGRAVIKGAILSLKENIPDARITLMSSHYERERQIYKDWNYDNVDLIDHIWYKEKKSLINTFIISGIFASYTFFKFSFYSYFKNFLPLKNEYQNYDIIIDLTTDGPNEHYGLFMALFSIFNTKLALMSGKPVAICAASIGPFKNILIRSIAKHTLNKVKLITVREEITKNYLKSFGIINPDIYLTADHAFLMKPASEERIDEIFRLEGVNKSEKIVIGISPSRLIYKYAFPEIIDEVMKYEKYVDSIIKTIKYIDDTINEKLILLIPHSGAASSMTPNEDDHQISKDIYKKAKSDNLKLISGDYDTDELKGIIGRCDIFIGCRMHATIASASMSVPTISVVYGHKSHGILGKMMNQEELIIEIGNCDPEKFLSEMKAKIDYVIVNKDVIKKELAERAKIAENRALLNGAYIKELLEKST